MKRLLAAAVLTAIASTAHAQNFYGMQNDMQLMNAINQMAMTLGNGCQMGDQSMCQSYNYVMQNANAMMGASNACMMGDQMGCNYYMQYYQQMDMDYAMFNQQMAAMQGGGMAGGYNPLGDTHQERMQAIQDFGAANTQNWQNHMNQMDANHEAFMQTLRE